MVRRREPRLRQQTILATRPPLTETVMVIPLEPLLLLRITLATRLPLIVIVMVIQQGLTGQVLITLVIPEQIIMILMATLLARRIVALTISELPELLIRIQEVILGEHQPRQQTISVIRTQSTVATTLMLTSGRGKVKNISSGSAAKCICFLGAFFGCHFGWVWENASPWQIQAIGIKTSINGGIACPGARRVKGTSIF